jgi:hydroxymethylpyrimidine pyrophosphatase-like HAD family hydrolase
MRAITLVDLDDTLFQTLRKCPPEVPVEHLTPIGFKADGSPMSYATPRQLEFIRLLSETTYLIPVTARSLAALRRVRLEYEQAICAHGGMILSDGEVIDSDWDASIRTHAAQHTSIVHSLTNALDSAASAAGVPVHTRVQMEGDIGLYPLARHEDADEVALNRVADAVIDQLPSGWTDHRNSNAVAFLPPYLGKQHAVAHLLPGLRARFPDSVVIGIGDSISDAPFMNLCDFAMTPTASQLAKAASSGLFSR